MKEEYEVSQAIELETRAHWRIVWHVTVSNETETLEKNDTATQIKNSDQDIYTKNIERW